MKKLFLQKLTLSFVLGIILTLNCSTLTLAQTNPATTTPTTSTEVVNPTSDQLLPHYGYTTTNATTTDNQNLTNDTKIGAVNALPNGTWQQALAGFITILLNISGGLALLGLTIGGVLMLTANGNADGLGKGKKVVVAAIAGLIVIAISYALVIGVSQLQFFTPGTKNTATTTTSGATTDPAKESGSKGASTDIQKP